MHIALAYPSLSRGHEKEDVFNAVNNALGGSMSSRLFQEVREKRGLAYSVYSYSSPVTETGSHIIYAGVNPEQKLDAYEAILEIINDLKKNGITENEFLRSREQMKSGLFFSNESTNSQMLLYGKYALYFNKQFDFEERLRAINAMTYTDAMDVCRMMFDEKYKAVALVGATDNALPL